MPRPDAPVGLFDGSPAIATTAEAGRALSVCTCAPGLGRVAGRSPRSRSTTTSSGSQTSRRRPSAPRARRAPPRLSTSACDSPKTSPSPTAPRSRRPLPRPNWSTPPRVPSPATSTTCLTSRSSANRSAARRAPTEIRGPRRHPGPPGCQAGRAACPTEFLLKQARGTADAVEARRDPLLTLGSTRPQRRKTGGRPPETDRSDGYGTQRGHASRARRGHRRARRAASSPSGSPPGRAARPPAWMHAPPVRLHTLRAPGGDKLRRRPGARGAGAP